MANHILKRINFEPKNADLLEEIKKLQENKTFTATTMEIIELGLTFRKKGYLIADGELVKIVDKK